MILNCQNHTNTQKKSKICSKSIPTSSLLMKKKSCRQQNYSEIEFYSKIEYSIIKFLPIHTKCACKWIDFLLKEMDFKCRYLDVQNCSLTLLAFIWHRPYHYIYKIYKFLNVIYIAHKNPVIKD